MKKEVTRFIVLLYCLSAAQIASAKDSFCEYANGTTLSVFGSPLSLFTMNDVTLEKIKKRSESLSLELAKAWDPDCYYRPLIKGECTPAPNGIYNAAPAKMMEKLMDMDPNIFSFVTFKNGKEFKDYGAIGQGAFLEILKSEFKSTDFSANFSGDIYISPLHNKSCRIEVPDPVLRGVSLYTIDVVKNQGAWIFYEGGPELGTQLRKDSKSLKALVLIGPPELNGGELDGLATGILVGGKGIFLKGEVMVPKIGERLGVIYFNKDNSSQCLGAKMCGALEKDGTLNVTHFRD